MANYFDDDFYGNAGDQGREEDIDKLMEELLEGIDLSEEEPVEAYQDEQSPREEMFFETEDEELDLPKARGKAGRIVLILLCVVLGIGLVAFGAYTAIGMLTGQEPAPIVLTTEEVPHLVGMDYSSLPAEMKVTVVKAGEEYDDMLPAGQILRQEPVAGTKVEPGAEVAVVVSLGEEPVKLTMPETLVGMTLEEAQAWAQEQEIPLNVTTEEVFSESEANVVLKVTPEAGAALAAGDTVLLTVSKGNTSQVPQVVGMTEAEALEALKAAGFENVKTAAMTSGEPEGTVLTQSMGAGQTMKVANLIVLRVAGESADVPEAQAEDTPAETKPAQEAPKQTEPAEQTPTEPEEETAATEQTTEATEQTESAEETEPEEA